MLTALLSVNCSRVSAGKLQVLLARGRHGRAGDRADGRADQRAFAAAGDAAEDGAETGAAADLARRLLPLAAALDGRVLGGHLVDAAADRRRC